MKTDVSPAYAVIGHHIQRARLDAKLTQEELGRRVGLSRTSINNIEHGRQKIFVHTLLHMAEACRVQATVFLPQEPVLPSDVFSYSKQVLENKDGDKA